MVRACWKLIAYERLAQQSLRKRDRFVACGVPEVENFDLALSSMNAIVDADRAVDKLSD